MNPAITIVVLLVVVAALKASKTGFYGRFGGAVSGVYTVNGSGT